MTDNPLDNLPDLDAIDTELARRSLHDFIQQSWRFADPAPFIDSWHIGAICEHLEAVARRQIRKLLINIPPRHSKSLLTSVFFPAWLWIDRPQERVLSASYSIELSRKDSRLCRQLMLSPWYQQRFGASFKLRPDQNEKADYENDHGGGRRATSVGGGGTGLGGSMIIVDDPLKALDSSSENERQTVIDWWNQTMSTRLNDPETGVKIVIMQRLHEADLAGYIMKYETGWDHLCLPARYESERRCVTSIGWIDPRREEGQLLCPERFDAAATANLEASLGSWATAGQLQQRPSPREGGNIKAHWFRFGDTPAHFDRIVLSFDCGGKTQKKNDPTVIGVWGQLGGRHYRLAEWRERVDFLTLKAAAVSMCAAWNPAAVLIEDTSNGIPLIQQLPLEPGFHFPIIAINPIKDKVTRLDAVSPMIEAGLVILPAAAPWVADYIAELTSFPMGTHDDRVDETSQYLTWARGSRDFTELLKGVAVANHSTFGGNDGDRGDGFEVSGGREDPFDYGERDIEGW